LAAQFQILFQFFRILQKRIGYPNVILLDDAVTFEQGSLVFLEEHFEHVLRKTETESACLIKIREHMAFKEV